jgi:hypothetical protein
MKFRKKPAIVEAVQWMGNNCEEMAKFMGRESITDGADLVIYTLEGNMRANVGDWIIRGVSGELYPCKSDIFQQTYELVEEEDWMVAM